MKHLLIHKKQKEFHTCSRCWKDFDSQFDFYKTSKFKNKLHLKKKYKCLEKNCEENYFRNEEFEDHLKNSSNKFLIVLFSFGKTIFTKKKNYISIKLIVLL